ncbi:MAG: peptidoglycan DD-metalloendopeptidase family protein [Bacteroidales bacterium]|jgi:murein DD-endopeptidase MepM/ murein hydrolase activator NlpD|nr:peptidoglycan DD-metalloendopeptidase family protein [Bacteroidales bacterium]
MKMIPKISALFVLLFVFETAYSQLLTDSIQLLQEDVSIEDDEIGIDSLIALVNNGSIDSTTIPAAKLYGYRWDNVFVNPYNRRLADMPDTAIIDFSQYCHPNKNVVTSDFGFRKGWRFHYGIDTRLKVGDTICASFDGMVRISKRGRAYGNYVVIRHFNGLETVYAHLSRTLVKVNQVVHAGEVIGLGGNTGRSTGPHLHYEVRYLGQPIPPRDVIDWETYQAKDARLYLNAGHFAYVKEIEQIRYYVVRKGDTLSGIASKTGVRVSKLCELNRIKKTSILRPGQRLRFT